MNARVSPRRSGGLSCDGAEAVERKLPMILRSLTGNGRNQCRALRACASALPDRLVGPVHEAEPHGAVRMVPSMLPNSACSAGNRVCLYLAYDAVFSRLKSPAF